MANWYGAARTNYFHVKDVDAFKEEFKDLEVEIFEGDESRHTAGMVGLLGRSEFGDFPSNFYDEGADDYIEIDVVQMVAKHLVVGEVAVFQTVGQEKLRYLTGRAVAVNSAGETETVDIDDIYERAKRLGTHIGLAVY